MPIKAKKLFNPVGSITLTVVTLNDNNQPQEETLTFQHRLVTAGDWVETQYEPPKPEAKPETPEDPAEAEARAKAEAERLAFLMSVKPDDLTDEQLAEVVSRVPIVREVFDFLVGWDVVGDDDKPLPITLRNLLKLDLKLVKEMSSEHYKATFPNWTT